MTDEEFVAQAIRQGSWERYEHPQKGETFTLQMGKFPILSLHNILVERDAPTTNFWEEMRTPEMVALLLARVARLEYELSLAIKMLADAPDAISESDEHEPEVS